MNEGQKYPIFKTPIFIPEYWVYPDNIIEGVSSNIIIGEIRIWNGLITDIPDGWLVCDGSLISKTQYPELFDELNYTYGGSGDDFSLPPQSSIPIGADDTDFLNISYRSSSVSSGGTKNVPLSTHTHTPSQAFINGFFSNIYFNTADRGGNQNPTNVIGGSITRKNIKSGNLSSVGSGTELLPPFIATILIIRAYY